MYHLSIYIQLFTKMYIYMCNQVTVCDFKHAKIEMLSQYIKVNMYIEAKDVSQW